MQSDTFQAGIYTDFQGLGKLKAEAKKQTAASQREAAQQFEALFIQAMLKSMRSATPGDSLTGNDQVELYQDMLDKQISIDMANNGGIGIARIIEQQFAPTGQPTPRQNGNSISSSEPSLAFAVRLWRSGDETGPYSAKSGSRSEANTDRRWKSPEDFVHALMPAARAAAAKLGTDPEAIVAVAALETGWGKHIIPRENGLSSHNLFGIKANEKSGSNFVDIYTLEFEQGKMQKVKQRFRSYSSPTASVADFARFLLDNPRYQKALSYADQPEIFIQELQAAGYATDPEYANKVITLLHQIQAMG